jgi:acetate---CoA ligase (ADP-forming)
MATISEQVRSILSPKSVAIVGASSDYTKFTGRTLKYLLKHGYQGRICPVNPKYEEMAGLKCFPSVDALPEGIETAFIQIPSKGVPAAIKDCVNKGIKGAIIHSAGLGESGEEGRKRQQEIKEMIEGKDLRLVGPNTAGVANIVERIILTPVVAYELDELTTGRIGLISQSGGLTGAILTRAEARGIGFSYIVSTGNEMDLEVSDYIRFLVDDPHTDVITLFLETLRQIDHFYEAVDLAYRKGKPILALKVGKAEVGARAAASHTGALTGSDAVYNAVFRQKGIIRLEALEDLFEVSSLFCRYKPPKGNRIGILTTTGGGATILADACGVLGLRFPRPSEKTILASARGLPDFASRANPLDVTMAGVGGGYEKSLDLFLRDENFDIIVPVVGTSAQFEPEMGVKPILERDKSVDKPVVSFLNPNAEKALKILEKEGIPTFRTPEACARALRNLCDYGEFLRKRHGIEDVPVPLTSPIDRGRIASLIDSADRALDEYQSKWVLSEYGVPVVNERRVQSVEEGLTVAKEMGFPVVLKVLSPDLLHKTEARAVKLGISSEREFRDAYAEILENAGRYRPAAKIEGILVQEMVRGGTEVIVGVSQDLQFGPTVMFGLGGIFVEVYKDVSLRVAPIKRIDAEEMIREVKGSVLLEGHRGREKGDVEGVIDVLLRVSQLAIDLKEKVEELDINPLIVLGEGQGVKAVDALIVKRRPHAIG